MKVVRVLLLSLLVLFSCLSTTFPTAAAASSGYETDRLSLIDVKNQLTDGPSGALRSWSDSNDVCNWTGVSCSSRSSSPRRVTAIDLSSRGLSGSISPSIANLTFLTNLTVANNGFYGPIPPEIGSLRRLQLLDLSYNSFHGPIPANLAHCSNLAALELGSNSLSGTIPTDLGLLSSLGFMSLQNNSLAGEIPASIGNLSSLYHLDLRINQLRGTIPEGLGGLLQLQYFQVSANELSGTVPRSMYNLSSLYYFGVAGNRLEGSLPQSMGTTLPNLEQLLVGGNRFEGTIPISLPNASRIFLFEMSVNGLSGNVPPDLGRLASLYYLNLEYNALESSGPDGWAFLASLANCTRLKMLGLDNNNFTGDLPESVANLSTSLQELRLNVNQISGTIPPGIGNLINLTILALGPNLVAGSIPESIGMLARLQLLTLHRSRLVGSIPASLGNLTQLVYLYLGENGFGGQVPSSLGNLDKLEVLVLGKNGFTGAIPGEIFGLPSLTTCSLGYNSFVGPLPSEVGKSRYLNGLYVAGNKLSGELPSTLGACQMLEVVDLKQNFFQGSVPSSLGNLKGLQWLDLSRNNLSGPVPEFLASLSLVYLNLSFNEFEGEVPVKGIFGNATATSLLGNGGLCGGNLTFRLPPCLAKSSEKRSRATLLLKLAIAGAGVVFFLTALFLTALVIPKMKPRSGTAVTAPVAFADDRYPRASYADLAKATDGFSNANLIGTGSYGSVYRGRLELVRGAEVAVKVFNLRREGASKSFTGECEALRSIRHRNLVRVLTSCSSVDTSGGEFKALVFELLPNGNLDSWLHPEGDGGCQSKRLNLTQRVNVAVDVADALEYLHCDCQVPVVHCDLKPSNIILDYDMVARVGDFGLASLVREAMGEPLQATRSSIGVKGTIGYVAPEYGVGGRVSTSGDVYSYGILLLEMFTGMRPVSDVFKDGLSLRELVQASCPGRVMEIIDPVLLLAEGEGSGDDRSKSGGLSRSAIGEYAASVLMVGLSCSRASSRERPNIRDVAAELHTIREKLLLAAGASERCQGD